MTKKEYLSILNQIALNYDAEYVNECHDDFCISMRNNIKQLENLIKEHFDNPPLKFEELKRGMWVWDDKFKDCMKIKIIFKPCKSYPNGSLKAYHDLNEETLNFIEFEEGRFFPVTKALEYQE